MKKLILLCVSVLAVAAVAQPFYEGKYVIAPTPAFMPGDSAHDFDVRFYRADLDLPMTSGAMTARVRIDLTPRHAGFDTFSLHMVNLVCDSIRRAGRLPAAEAPAVPDLDSRQSIRQNPGQRRARVARPRSAKR